MSDLHDATWRPRGSVWLVAGAATLAPFMEILDTTIVNVSLPYIAGTLSASNDDATWTLTSYLVANGVVVPVAGWLGRLIGRKRYFLTCIAMFTVCSFLCGIATSLPQLVMFRLLQGLFGGGLQPCQQSVILDTFEPSQRGKAFSLVAIAVIFAPIIGPTLGGWITDNYTWRWVFLINVPVGIVAFIAVLQLVEDPPWVQRDRAHLRDIDYGGLGLIALGLGSLQIMLDRGEDNDWFSSPTIKLFGLLAAVGIVGGIAWLLLVEKPVVNLRCLKDRNFGIGVVMVFWYRGDPVFQQRADPGDGTAMVRLHRIARRSPAVARRRRDDPVHPHRREGRVAECPDPLCDRVRFLRAGLFGGVRQSSDAAVGFLDPRNVPGVPDRRSGIPVRPEQYVIVFYTAAFAECRRGSALFDVS